MLKGENFQYLGRLEMAHILFHPWLLLLMTYYICLIMNFHFTLQKCLRSSRKTLKIENYHLHWAIEGSEHQVCYSPTYILYLKCHKKKEVEQFGKGD